MIPGEIIICNENITLNADREVTTIKVYNSGDRAVQVGSHFHFFEANRCLCFERALAFGKRLDIPSGTAVRIESGETKEISLVPLAGRQAIYGLNDLTHGNTLDETKKAAAVAKANELGFKGGDCNELSN